jgi:hypothetical protein
LQFTSLTFPVFPAPDAERVGKSASTKQTRRQQALRDLTTGANKDRLFGTSHHTSPAKQPGPSESGCADLLKLRHLSLRHADHHPKSVDRRFLTDPTT